MRSLAIALFAPYLPAPAISGGRIRIHRLALGLAELGELELFAAASRRELEAPDAAAALGPYKRVHVAEAWLPVVPGLSTPVRVRRARPGGLVTGFRRAHARRRFDVIVAEHSHAAAVAFQTPHVPWLLDEHNVESRYLEEHAAASGPIGALGRHEVRALARWERAMWGAATEIVAVSRADAAYIERVSRREPTLIPNGVVLADIPFKLPSQRQGAQILFVGLLSHPPNVAACRFLAREVLPRVLSRVKEARLILCGARPAREVQELAGKHVEVTGTVASVVPYLEGAAVYANALGHGGGTSLKVLEALAAGVPLISTAVGVRGFDLSAPRHYLAAESADDFAAALLACLEDRQARDAAAHRGRDLAQGYDWAELSARFAAMVERVATHRNRGNGP